MPKVMCCISYYATIVLIIIYQYTTCIATSVLYNAKTDQASLLSFQNHLISNPSNSYMKHLSRNWSMDGSVCSWVGVLCGTRHRRVVALNLTNFGLSGTIAPHLGNLTFLRSLDLSENNLTGIMPNELRKLRRLSYLNVGFNMLSGEIPPWFGSLKKLEHLRLQNNNFSGPIPDSFENFKAIKTIVLRSNQLIGSVPSGLFNISSLLAIDLKYNNLSGSLPIQMCGGNGYSRLTKLLLSFNQFSGKIPSTLQGCRNLEELSLFGNQLTGSIPLEIGNLTMLKALYLSQNNLEGELPPGLGNLKLEVISMRSCNLSGRIPHTIFNMSSLGLLDLAKNRFYGQIPPTLGIGLQNLEGIFLSENSLTGTIPSLANASALMQIFMFENLFHGPIPTTLGNLRLLRIINLGGNNLTGDAPNQELRFLSSLTNCRYLMAAEFSQNPLNGILPSSIGNFSDSLTYLAAFTSKLKGEIPREIANLRSLDGIYFDSNGLTGHIPWEMGNMKQLERVYLNHNRLEGQIPTSLCQLNNLGDLFLSDNLLFGPIPTCLAEIKSLRRIYIDSNKFNSSVPNNLWSLSDLVGLNLSSNLLTGSLPDSIKELEHINELGLSHNQFSGNISSSIGSFQSLTYLSLSHNNFQGVIPQSLKKLLSLEFLDLSFNNLSGRIPKSLEELNFLYYFNVSFNRLEGEIPTGGQFYNFTYMSYLHNDALCGEVLQVPRCKTRIHHRSLLKYILLSLLSSVILVSLAVFLFLKTRKRNTTMLQVPDQLRSTWKEISYLELLRATDTFSDANLLGRGSFGTVYKGRLSDGQDVAVKVFHLEYEGGIRSFFAECEVLRNIRHRNLVKVISCCSNQDFKALVLEFMPNESLDKWLHSPNRFLNMHQRLSIALDVSEALEYIHHDHISPIIHRDIKPSNIVLDEDMVAHVCDFGIAKLFAEGESIARTETLATIGYIAPEYATDGIVSTSGDVYSYGTILVEMFTGKKPTDEMFGEEMSMFDWVSSANGDAILDLVDIKLFEEENINGFPAKKQSLTLIFELAKDCMRSKPQERIKMREVVARLEKIKLISEAT